MIELAPILVIIVVLVITGIWKIMSSDNWINVGAEIIQNDIEEIYNRPGSLSSKNERSFEYKINLKYKYVYNGKTFTGNTVYPGLPNIFSHKNVAQEIHTNYPPGKRVEVFINPQKPAESSLFSFQGIPKKNIILIVIIMLFMLALIVGGIILFMKKF